ncbi:MAG: hypothetical protein ABI162_17575 [Luteolibacter sp.]
MSRRVIHLGLLLASLVSASATPPAWWASRGATDAYPPNDGAAANQGQLKQFTQKAVQEFNARMPGGAGADLNGLVNGWVQAYQAGGYNATNFLPADFEAMTSGQLKWIANKIHARLVFAKYEDAPPAWLVQNPATDKQLVNLGQLKTVFNFDLTVPTGQLPEWWQKFYFNGQTGYDPTGDDDGDGLTNAQELTLGTNPNNPDADGDGMPDGWEVSNDLNPLDAGDGTGDPDNDGLTNLQEYQAGTNPHDYDTDNDSLPDGWEIQHFSNSNQTGIDDPDGDGLSNWLEFVLGFDPQNAATNGTPDASRDRDGDGMPDAWEASFGYFEWDSSLQHRVFHCLIDWNQADSGADPDNDDLTNLEEYQSGTNPADYDTDDDRLPDGWEIEHFSNLSQTADGDPDGDGIPNWVEYVLGFDPMDSATDGTPDSIRDTDEDGMPDAWEASFGHFEWDANQERSVFHRLTDWDLADDGADPDGDNLTNLQEYEGGTDPGNSDVEVDTDNDSLPDSWEIQHFSNLSEAADGDPDGDGVPNWVEYVLGFDPLNPETDGTPDAARDTDGDGMPDAWEASFGHFEWDPDLQRHIFHPLTDWNIPDDDADSDGDGITNLQEYDYGTNPGDPEVQSENNTPQENAIPKYEIIRFSKTEFTYYLPQIVSINPTAGNSVTYTTNGTDPRVFPPSSLTVSVLTKITCQSSVTIRATASEHANDPTYDETKYVQVTPEEANFNLLNRRPRYCLRVDAN